MSELIDYLTDIITKLVSSCMLAQTHLEVALFFCYAFSKKVFFCYVHKLYSLWQIGSTSRLHPFHSLSLSRSAYLFPSLISSCVRDEKRSRPRQAPSRLCTAFLMRTIVPFSSCCARYPHPWGWQVTSAPKPINWNNPQLPRGASKVLPSGGWGGWGCGGGRSAEGKCTGRARSTSGNDKILIQCAKAKATKLFDSPISAQMMTRHFFVHQLINCPGAYLNSFTHLPEK